jgi:transcriptional regulator with XRE-family HTH domain
MELGKQIRKYRNELSLSQDDLAERIFVSRQTISNWENDKSYPDVNSLVLLSEVFATSIDNLIKGDIELMKEQINNEDRRHFVKLGNIYSIMLAITIITPIPLGYFLGYIGIGLWAILSAVALYVAYLVDKLKKKYDIHTYREIIAFTEGRRLDEIAKAREEGKRPYQLALSVFVTGVISLVIALVINFFLKQA